MENIKFSIVIPSMNSIKFIDRAIKSITSQSYSNYEIIAVDGGSTDGTIEILEKYSDNIDKLIVEPDKGQSDAFNKGFSHANGDYYFWLNSDDVLMPNTLLRIEEELRAHPKCTWLTFNTVFIDEWDRINFFHIGPNWNTYLVKGRGPQVDSPTSVFHRDLFAASEGFDLRLKYAMDIDLWYQFLKLGHQWRRLNHYAYAFRMHEDSKTGSQGYNATPSAEKNRQGRIIAERHDIEFKKSAELLSKTSKALFAKPMAAFETLKWRGRPIDSYRAK